MFNVDIYVEKIAEGKTEIVGFDSPHVIEKSPKCIYGYTKGQGGFSCYFEAGKLRETLIRNVTLDTLIEEYVNLPEMGVNIKTVTEEGETYTLQTVEDVLYGALGKSEKEAALRQVLDAAKKIVTVNIHGLGGMDNGNNN